MTYHSRNHAHASHGHGAVQRCQQTRPTADRSGHLLDSRCSALAHTTAHYSDSAEVAPEYEIPWATLSLLTPLMIFFLVFFISQCYNRFMQLFNLCNTMETAVRTLKRSSRPRLVSSPPHGRSAHILNLSILYHSLRATSVPRPRECRALAWSHRSKSWR